MGAIQQEGVVQPVHRSSSQWQEVHTVVEPQRRGTATRSFITSYHKDESFGRA